MVELNFKEIAIQMKELEIKASKYDELKENVEEIVEKINDKFNEVKELLAEINPLLSVSKGHYTKKEGWGNITTGYIEKMYKYLIESPDTISLPDLKVKVGLGHLYGGSEQAVRNGLIKLPHIRYIEDSTDRRKMLFKYEGTLTKLDFDVPKYFKENVKKEQLGDIKIDEDDEKIEKQIPKKFSHMG